MNEIMESIWKDHHDQLLNFINKQVKDRDESEDILQDVFVKILLKIDTLKDSSKLQAWIYQMTRNAIADYFRKKNHLNGADNQEIISEVEEQSAMNEATGWIGYYVDALPESYRDSLVMYEMKGYSQKEIAERLGISYTNARSRIQRGRQLLKKNLTDCCEFNVDTYGNIIEYSPKLRDCSKC
jgi:RNA polymerase sigma-70 factor (ECF subfamily)